MREKIWKILQLEVSKSFSHEKIKFLFIGQGQVDTWHDLRGLSEASSSSNLEFNNKMTICTSSTNFAWLCEISNSTVAVIVFWSISHDYVKFSHDHEKPACRSSLSCNIIPLFGPFHMIMRNGNI